MEQIILMAVTLGLSLIITPVAIKFNIIDIPNDRKIHHKPIPKAGGLGIFVPFTAAAAWFVCFQTGAVANQNTAFVIITSLFVIIGIVDDKVELQARYKLMLQMLLSGVSIASGLMFKGLGWCSVPVTFLWYIGIINGINLIDGLDGLAGGIGLISSLTFGFMGLLINHHEICVIACLLVFGCLGFLVYNFHPAKIFMGDTGSLPLGYVLASIGILVSNASGNAANFMLPGIVLCIPIYDSILAILRRKLNNRPWFLPDRSHFYNLLMDLYGLSHKNAVMLIYGINAVAAATALIFLYSQTGLKLLILLALTGTAAILTVKFKFLTVDKTPVEISPLDTQKTEPPVQAGTTDSAPSKIPINTKTQSPIKPVYNNRFSVIMSVYKNDNPPHFRAALDSIINQTVPPTEIILVVDGPVSDGLMDTIREYESLHNCLKPICLEKNQGLGNAMAIAVEASSFELVARMDSDDISIHDRFEKQLACFEGDEGLSIVGGNISEFISEQNNIVGRRVVPADDREIKEYMKKRCPLNHMTVMFKKSQVLKAGNYKEWFWNEDYYLWVRMYQAGCSFKNLQETLVYVRVGQDMYKRRGGIKYFKSEAKLQKYMLSGKIIGPCRYIYNIAIRFIVQVLLPNSVRSYIFKKFARKPQVGLDANIFKTSES